MSLNSKLIVALFLASFVFCHGKEMERALFDGITEEAFDVLLDSGVFPHDQDTHQLNATTLMWLSILSGNVENVAYLLRIFEDTRTLGLGFRIPPVLRERALRTTNDRVKDGDVVALHGLAKAALDPALAAKLADVSIVATFGAGIVDRVCTEEQPAVYDAEGNPDCGTEVILNFIRAVRIAVFEDTEEMQRILKSNPDVSVLGRRGADLSKANIPGLSWICPYCYEADFCSTVATQCPYETPNDSDTAEDTNP